MTANYFEYREMTEKIFYGMPLTDNHLNHSTEKLRQYLVNGGAAEGWECHGKPITVKQYNVVDNNSICPIEEVAEIMLALYESYMQDEASDFNKNAYYIGEPWSNEDIETFTRENMLVY